jgi:hypothetical protein
VCGSFKAGMLATAGIQQLLQILIVVVLLLTLAVHCEGDSGRKYAVFQEVESKESQVLKYRVSFYPIKAINWRLNLTGWIVEWIDEYLSC